MPGIAGLISRQSPDACRRLIERMVGSMQHEKCHVSGTYSDPELGVFAGWVALERSFADGQPILSERGDLALLLAGECLAPASAGDVEQGGPRGPSGWLLNQYEQKGPGFVDQLEGLFSGVLIDRVRRKTLLFNDRYGFERVYVHEGRDGFFFASEAKALLRVLPELRILDEQAFGEFLQYGATLNWESLFRGVGILPGASLWSFTPDGTCSRGRYFVQATWESQPRLPPESFTAELGAVFRRVLPDYLESDQPIGISLTGGLDTRMIMSSRPRQGHDLVTYTFAGPRGDTLDVRLARDVARASWVPHHVLRLGQDFFSDFGALVDRTVYITDGYLGACGAHEIYLNREARELAPVRVTGNFGSEILRGATTFKPLGVSSDLFHPDLRRTMSEDNLECIRGAMHPVSFAAFAEVPWHLFGLARAAQSQLTTRTPYLNNELVALTFRAPPQLRRSSTPALRVIRDSCPGLARIPTDSGLLPYSRLSSLVVSPWYRATFKLDYWRNVELPKPLRPLYGLLSGLPGTEALLPRHRYLDYRKWFRSELGGHLRERTTDPQVLRSSLWNRRVLEHLAEDHISGRRNRLHEITAVLTCSAIERLLLHADA